MKIKSGELEQKLIQCIFKYKEMLQKKNYLAVAEREEDRKQLNITYQQLSTIRQKILDSKCYLQLGEVQKELTNVFLADETTPQHRLKMLSYVVKRTCHPLVFIAGRQVLLEMAPSRQEQNSQAFSCEQTSEKKTVSGKFKTREFSYGEIIKTKKSLAKLVGQNTSLAKLQKNLSLEDAEILSQLIASGEITLKIRKPKKAKESSFSVILKEQ